jgi:hypothetical protein
LLLEAHHLQHTSPISVQEATASGLKAKLCGKLCSFCSWPNKPHYIVVLSCGLAMFCPYISGPNNVQVLLYNHMQSIFGINSSVQKGEQHNLVTFFEWSPPTDILSDTYSDIISGILFAIDYGILSGIYFLTFYLAFYFAFCLAFHLIYIFWHILTFYPAVYLSYTLTF